MKKIKVFMAAVSLLLLLTVVATGCKSGAESKDGEGLKLSVMGSYSTGLFNESSAEIVSYEPVSKRLFFVNAHSSAVEIINLADPANPVKIGAASFKELGGGSANSVVVKNGIIAAAVEDADKQAPGMVVFFDIDGKIINHLKVGALPDMVTATPDGKYIVVACEGEPNDTYERDPEGGIAIIDISGGVEELTDADVKMVSFDESQLTGDVRITGPAGTTVGQDMEPEYIAISADSKYAYVTLQENNAIAKVDIEAAEIVLLKGLGVKDHSLETNALDAVADGKINISTYPVYGLYMPDAIASYTVNGETFLVTANEGDGREYGDEDDPAYTDEIKIKKLKLDEEAFPAAAELVEEIGSLKVSSADGDVDGDGDYDKLYTFGARSFTIWNSDLELVFDSGSDFERITAELYPEYFNCSNDDDEMDGRSKSKGPEPEGVTVAQINGKWYAFVLLERISGVMVYDITKPAKAKFVQYVNNRNFGAFDLGKPEDAGDLGPEGTVFISADKSPVGKPLLVVTNEVSGTATIYKID